MVSLLMDVMHTFSVVRGLSDVELLDGLGTVLGSSRRAIALVLVHLAEVEERRLHLAGGYASLFAYCTTRLGMSEDEAYRRIRVARLGRRFPSVLEQLASGQVSLSVAALLEPVLTEENHDVLLVAVSGRTVAQARDVLATWFPQPDALPFIRKLPDGRAPQRRMPAESTAPANTARPLAETAAPAAEQQQAFIGSPVRGLPVDAPHASRDTDATRTANDPANIAGAGAANGSAPGALAMQPPGRAKASTIEPLSSERYKVQLTASAELKRKIELARDLLRHAVPQGDLATIIERALDLLIDKTLQRRFASRSRCSAGSSAQQPAASSAVPPTVIASPAPSSHTGSPLAAPNSPSQQAFTVEQPATPGSPALATEAGSPPASSSPAFALSELAPAAQPPALKEPAGSALSANAPASPRSRHVPHAVRRTVFERDGLRCTWRGPDGTRCDSRAWLEHDHITPRGQGGADDATNGRLLCRAHNRLSAEHAYGQQTIASIIARRRAKRATRRQPTADP
jgi:hypothetical protein